MLLVQINDNEIVNFGEGNLSRVDLDLAVNHGAYPDDAARYVTWQGRGLQLTFVASDGEAGYAREYTGEEAARLRAWLESVTLIRLSDVEPKPEHVALYAVPPMPDYPRKTVDPNEDYIPF